MVKQHSSKLNNLPSLRKNVEKQRLVICPHLHVFLQLVTPQIPLRAVLAAEWLVFRN